MRKSKWGGYDREWGENGEREGWEREKNWGDRGERESGMRESVEREG